MQDKKVTRSAWIGIFLLIGIVMVKQHFRSIEESGNPVGCMEFNTSPKEYPELERILSQFAQQENFILDDNGATLPPDHGHKVFDLWLVRDGFGEVDIMGDTDTQTIVFVSFYTQEDDAAFRGRIEKLKQVLHERWPAIESCRGQYDRSFNGVIDLPKE